MSKIFFFPLLFICCTIADKQDAPENQADSLSSIDKELLLTLVNAQRSQGCHCGGYSDERAVIQGWLSSPAHCANIMNPHVKEMGVAHKGKYWTQVFGSED